MSDYVIKDISKPDMDEKMKSRVASVIFNFYPAENGKANINIAYSINKLDAYMHTAMVAAMMSLRWKIVEIVAAEIDKVLKKFARGGDKK